MILLSLYLIKNKIIIQIIEKIESFCNKFYTKFNFLHFNLISFKLFISQKTRTIR